MQRSASGFCWDQRTAKEAIKSAATVLLLDVPVGTVIGINKKRHVCGPKFKGVKMMPPGAHLVSFNTVSKEGDFSPTMSFFVHLKAGEVFIRRWNLSLEMLLPIDDEHEVGRLAQGAASFQFDAGLAPYNMQMHQEWRALTTYITSDLTSRLSPLNGGLISITAEAAPLSSTALDAERRLHKQLNGLNLGDHPAESYPQEQGMDTSSEASKVPRPATLPPSVGRCYYTRIPRHAKADGTKPEEVTAANLDKSGLLESLIQQKYSAHTEDILGELQFAFLTFLVGQSLEGFSQWKAIIHLMLSCESAPLQTLPLIYAKFLTVLQMQLQCSLGNSEEAASEQAAPLGVPMVDELLSDSFLKKLFQQFFEILEDSSIAVHPTLQAAVTSLQNTLGKELQWTFRMRDLQDFDSDDEYAPVVVDTE